MKRNRTQRLIRIVQLLQAGRRYDIEELAQELYVSRRTAFRDIRVLNDSGIVCHFDPDTESYVIDQSYYLPPVNVTIEEGLALMLLTRKFVNRQTIPSVSAAVSAGLKIESVLPAEVRRFCGRLLDGVSVDRQQVSDVESVAGAINRVQHAVAEKRKLHIAYDSYYERREIELTVHPYWVTFRRRGWYMIAYSEMHLEVRTFKFERIVDLGELDETFRPDPDFNIDHYFGNAWHMVRGGDPQHVEVHFSSKVAGNVDEVAWHPTQRTRRRSDGTLVFEADVDGVDEIAWWILGYGDQAIVKEPEILRLMISSHAKNLVRYYENGVTTPIARE